MRRFERIFRNGLYRSRKGTILGVCRGIAEYFDFSVFWTRIITLVLLFFSGFWPVMGLYFLAALIMKPEPVLPIQTDEEQEFYDSYIYSRKGATSRLKRRYDNLQRRLQRLEHTVTGREFDWESRLNG
jgi:phage shock protein C